MALFRLVIASATSLAVLGPRVSYADTCENSPSAAKLEIVIEGVKSSRGQMTGSLYPGEASQFLVKNGALKVWRVPASAPQTHMCIWLPNGPGTYAFAVYHDENSNGKWDHNLLRKIEGFGFSNNPTTLFSAPAYSQVKFEARGSSTTLHVRLRYP